MREILFRGKRVDNGEWIKGYYIKATHHWHERGIHEDWIVTGASQNGGWFNIHNRHAVVSETIGQYTGLTDENGTKIFEGDYWIDEDEGDIFVVEFRNGQFCFVIYGVSGALMEYGWDETAGGFGECDCEPMTDYTIENIEVIGNIHDHPELLKGGAE